MAKKYDYSEIIRKGYLFYYYLIREKERELKRLRLDLEDLKDTFEYEKLLFKDYSEIVLYNEYKKENIEKMCHQFSENRNKKTRRYAKKIEKMIKNQKCIFGTLTINDNYINDKEETFRKRLQRFFKNLNCKYICNIDYGWENERKHYHFIANVEFVPKDLWKYGFAYYEKITNKKEYALSDYINKMSNHATKETTKNRRVMTNITTDEEFSKKFKDKFCEKKRSKK